MFDLRKTSTEALAYLGDSVVEIIARRTLLLRGLTHSEDLNREALHYVTAASQARAMERILPGLSEEERQVFLSGKNLKRLRPPQSVSLETYRIASGMEVLFAYLYLSDRMDRAEELFFAGYEEEKKT
ncbi:MAG: Mini-ribonuclease 3 [Clostridia bacterium]|nr:Mini-ribonuclease 3 [Clostridia bacterium]